MQIIKVPGINAFSKTNGCRDSGNEIIAELDSIWSSEAGKPINLSLLNLEEIHVNNQNLEEQEELIYKNSLEFFEKQDKIIFLGGDHSISYATGKAFLNHCKNEEQESCLIVFDAHPDCMPPTQEPSHEEWLRALVEYGFPTENILLIGLRNSDQEEIIFLNQKKIKTISVNQINENLQEATDIITEFSYKKKLYISLDIDVIDPAFAPSVVYAEPGGLTSRQIIYIIQRLAMSKNLKAIDIVEVDSEKDKKLENIPTIKLAAKLLAELI